MSDPAAAPLPASNTSGAKPPTKPAPKKTRAVTSRRRARARIDLEEDEEVERAALSGSESEQPSSGTETESEDETEENVPTSHSTVPLNPSSATNGNGPTTTGANPPAKPSPEVQSEKANGAPIWSEMMQDDLLDANDSSLPVVDFADLSSHVEALSIDPPVAPARKVNKGKAKSSKAPALKVVPSKVEDTNEQEDKPKDAKDVTPKTPTAREAYMHRLNTDPSFVPVVGRFWSHDDRLLDKDLRGMSTWWRMRGRGYRGGHIGRGGRGGRGGFGGSMAGSSDYPANGSSPVEQQWVHDGYEELAKMDDAKNAGRGVRGGIRVRPTRGWFKGPRRGSHSHSVNETQPRQHRQVPHPSVTETTVSPSGPSPVQPTQSKGAVVNNVPDQSVTKATEPQPPALSGVVVKVPSAKTTIVPVNPPGADEQKGRQAGPSKKPITTNRVNIPKKAPKTLEAASSKAALPAIASTSTSAPLKVTAPVVSPSTIHTPQQPPSKTTEPSRTASQPKPKAEQPVKRPLRKPSTVTSTNAKAEGGEIPPRLENKVEASISVENERSSLAPEDTPAQESVQPKPAGSAPPISIPPILATTAPGPYGSQYSYAALPPGIAMGESGMLYEISTGRPVVLNQPTPPPATAPVPMFTPRPVLHSHMAPRLSSGAVPYIPPHMHSSMTPDFHTPPPPHIPHPRFAQDNFMYPVGISRDSANGTPTFFAPPRQSGRLEIKPPTNVTNTGAASSSQATSSNRDSTHTNAASGSDKPSSSHIQQSPTHPQYPPNMQYPTSEQYYNGAGYYPPSDATGAYPLMEPSSLATAHPPTEDHTSYTPMYGAYYHPQQYPQGYNPYAEVPQDGSYNPYGNPSGPAPAYY